MVDSQHPKVAGQVSAGQLKTTSQLKAVENPISSGATRGSSTTDSTSPIREVSELGPRERILQASLELFVSQGYFNTNVPDISRASRCSVGSIYHHFANKEEIADQLYKDGMRQFREALTSGIEGCKDLESTVRNVVVAFLGFSENHHLLARYLWLARHSEFLSSKVAKPTVVGFDVLGRKLTRVIKDAVRAKQIPPLKAEIIWSIVFGIPLSFLTDWLDGYTASTPSQAAPMLAESCLAALKGSKLRS